MILGIVDDIVVALLKLLILLVAGIYKLVSGFYQIFLILSRTNIFDQDTYQHLTDKVYVILAVVMLFVLAYNFITLIIDPDKNKGGSVVEKIIKNAVTSLILIVICPTLFSFAFDLQDAILNQGVITKFFTIDNPVTGKPYDAATSIQEGGNMMAAYTFKAFFAPAHDGDNSGNITNKGKGKNYNGANCGSKGGCTLAQAEAYAEKTGTFAIYTAFAANWHESDSKMGVDFSFLMAIIAGFYLIYVIISFCFDLAVRVIKLAFYQIIAPICIACRILPDKESIFKNWWKAVVKTYLSVFIRIFIMNMAVFLMILITDDDQLIPSVCPTCSLSVRLLAYAFLIMGLLMFVKQSTKLIDEIFQLGDVNLGIASKLKEGGAFTAGAAIGAGVTTTARNISHTISKARTAKQEGKSVGAAVIKGMGQTLTGVVRGTYDGAKSGWNAGSYKDMQNAAKQGTQAAIDTRDAHETYREAHHLGKLEGAVPVVGGIAVAANRIKDMGKNISRWAGFNNADELESYNKAVTELAGTVDTVVSSTKQLLQSKADGGKGFSFGVTSSATATSLQKANAHVSKDVAMTLQRIRDFDDMIKTARETGSRVSVDWLSDTYDFSSAELERIKGKFMADYSKVAAETAMQTDENYKTTTAAWEIEEKSAFADIRTKGDKARKEVKKVLGSSIINEANAEAAKKGGQQLTSDTIEKENLRFTGDAALDKLQHVVNDTVSKNQVKINDIRRQEQEQKGKK